MEEFKVCTICKVKKIIDDFNKKKSSLDGRQNFCRMCNSRHSKKHYNSNKEKIKQRTRDREERLRPLVQKFILQYLEKGCIDCGEKDIIVLDFDHTNNKEYNISTMITNCAPLDKLEKEINKCVVRCANCHRRKTAKDFDWWRYKLSIS